MLVHRLVGLACVVGSVIYFSIGAAEAQNPVAISGVTVVPTGTITPADPVSLDVFLTSGSASIQLYSPTQVQIVGNDIAVDVYAMAGLLAIPDARNEIVALGTFGPGTYTFQVRQNGPTFAPPIVFGGFQVVPEPISAGLAAIAIATGAMARFDRRKDRRCG